MWLGTTALASSSTAAQGSSHTAWESHIFSEQKDSVEARSPTCDDIVYHGRRKKEKEKQSQKWSFG
jgi:hypothetical protein